MTPRSEEAAASIRLFAGWSGPVTERSIWRRKSSQTESRLIRRLTIKSGRYSPNRTSTMAALCRRGGCVGSAARRYRPRASDVPAAGARAEQAIAGARRRAAAGEQTLAQNLMLSTDLSNLAPTVNIMRAHSRLEGASEVHRSLTPLCRGG
jgi:hypothetical protein